MILAILFLLAFGWVLIRLGVEMWKLAFIFLIFAMVVLVCGGLNVEAHEYHPADIVYIGKVVQHEAGNQSDLGKRLVADTILNRVESDKFPNTVYEVIMQPGQYFDPAKTDYPPKSMYRLVAEEIYSRTNDQVLWYRTRRYHGFGKPIIKEGNHYFSGGK